MSRLAHAGRVALDSLRRHPLRTTLSTLGIIMGAASLAAVLALGDGAERLARQRVEREGLNLVAIRARTEDVVDGVRIARTGYPLFDDRDLESLAGALGRAMPVHIRVDGSAWLAWPGQPRRAARVVAERVLHGTASLPLARGRTLTEVEMREGRAVAVVSATLAMELAKANNGTASSGLTIGGVPHAVVGELAPFAGEQGFLVFVPFAERDRVLVPAATPRVPMLLARPAAVEDVPGVKRTVESFAQARWPDAVRVEAAGPQRLKDLAQAFLVFKMLMGAFTAISLVVGGIGITNVLLASMLERIHEIGIRKAVGARRRDLLVQFLAESVAVSGAGAVAGALIGVVGAMAVAAAIRARTGAPMVADLTWPTLVVSAGAAIVVGLLAGIYPAWRASRLEPVEAIQRE